MAGDDASSFTSSYTFLDHPGPIPFAHRGGSLEGAGELARRRWPTPSTWATATWRPTAQLTSDGVLVVPARRHASTGRPTGPGQVAEQTWAAGTGRPPAQPRRLRSATEGAAPPRGAVQPWPDARINVDAKDERAVEPLVALVRRLDAVDRVCLGSFKRGRHRRHAPALGPGLCTRVRPLDVVRLRLGRVGGLLGKVAGACAQVPVRQKVAGPLAAPGRRPRLPRAAHDKRRRRSTCGRSTTRPRCAACWTSASTAS